MNDKVHLGGGDVDIDIGALFRALVRTLPVIILLVGLVAVATFFYLSSLPPKYQAEARVLIESGESRLTRPDNTTPEDATLLDEGGVQSQVQLIRSRDLARAVADELGLASLAEFNPALAGPSFIGELLITVGLKNDESATTDEERVLNRFYEELAVFPIEKSRVISIEFSATDPDLAARAANLIADKYLELQRAAKRENTDDAAEFLAKEIDGLRERVATAELEVAKFRSGSDLFVGGQNNNTTLAQQQLTEFNTELGRVRAARADAEAKAAAIRTGLQNGVALESSDMLNSPQMQRLRERQGVLRARIAELSATLLPAHPRMQQLRAQLADEEGQMRQEALKVVSSLETDAKLALAREAQIQKDLAQLKAAAARSNTDEVQLRALEREASAQRELLETYLRRYRDALARQSGDYLPADARIISRAAPAAEPYFPRVLPMTFMVAVAAGLLLMLIVLVRELASGRPMRRVSYAAPLPAEPDAVPVDGHLRWADGGSVRRVLPVGAVAPANSTEAVEQSLAAIAKRIVGADAHRVLVTRASPDEETGERPLAAVALARSVSRLGGKVVLVDLVRDDVTHLAMGEDEDLPGLTDIYAGDASFAQAIFRDRSSSAHFIPAGRADLGPGELSTDRLANIFDALVHTYDHVIFDAGEGMIDFLAHDCDAAVLVSEMGAADPRTVRAHERLVAAGAGEVMLLSVDPTPASGEVAA